MSGRLDNVEKAGVGLAVGGHVLLFWLLSSVKPYDPPKPPPPSAMEVAFVETPAIDMPVEAPQPQAEAPEIGAIEEPAPAPEVTPTPVVEPAPVPEPVVVARPPEPIVRPAPRPEPVRAKPVQAAPKPRPAPKPAPVKVAAKPTPPKPAPAKATPAKTAPAKTVKAAPTRSASTKPAPTKVAAAPAGKGRTTTARAPRLGRELLAGLSDPSPVRTARPAAAGPAAAKAAPAISANDMAAIQGAIRRQIQPCANRQVNPGPGANRIMVKLNLRLNKDGSLAAPPRVVSTSGVDDENERYKKRVSDLAIAAYKGCAPMRGLPVDLYRTAKGGWSNVNMNYKLPG